MCGERKSSSPVLSIQGVQVESGCSSSSLPQKITHIGRDLSGPGGLLGSILMYPSEAGLGLHVALNPKGLRPGCRPLSRPTGGSMNTLAPAPSGSPPLPLGH